MIVVTGESHDITRTTLIGNRFPNRYLYAYGYEGLMDTIFHESYLAGAPRRHGRSIPKRPFWRMNMLHIEKLHVARLLMEKPKQLIESPILLLFYSRHRDPHKIDP